MIHDYFTFSRALIISTRDRSILWQAEKPISGYTQLTEFITGLRILVQRTGVTTLNHIELDTVLNGLIRYESDVVNNVTTSSPGLVLDARQGKVLKDLIDAIIASKGVSDGIATLAGDGKVPSSQLPSYVDDVIEVADYAALPTTGETGKIYVTLDTNKTYRWSGTAYVELTDDTAIWGQIAGTLANQADLEAALNLKETVANVDAIKGTSWTDETIKGNADAIALRELLANKRTTWQATPTNTAYPSERLVKDSLDEQDARLTSVEAKVTALEYYGLRRRSERGVHKDRSGCDDDSSTEQRYVQSNSQ